MHRSPRRPALLAALLLSACAPQTPRPILSAKSPVELRAMQSRQFDTADRARMLRQVIATLQDLGYNIDKVEASAGTVTATKLAQLHLTATVIPFGAKAVVVRANALIGAAAMQHQVDDPRFYQQDFFDPLAHAMVLEALPAPAQDVPVSALPGHAMPAG